jgi:hypothetical protein
VARRGADRRHEPRRGAKNGALHAPRLPGIVLAKPGRSADSGQRPVHRLNLALDSVLQHGAESTPSSRPHPAPGAGSACLPACGGRAGGRGRLARLRAPRRRPGQRGRRGPPDNRRATGSPRQLRVPQPDRGFAVATQASWSQGRPSQPFRATPPPWRPSPPCDSDAFALAAPIRVASLPVAGAIARRRQRLPRRSHRRPTVMAGPADSR